MDQSNLGNLLSLPDQAILSYGKWRCKTSTHLKSRDGKLKISPFKNKQKSKFANIKQTGTQSSHTSN